VNDAKALPFDRLCGMFDQAVWSLATQALHRERVRLNLRRRLDLDRTAGFSTGFEARKPLATARDFVRRAPTLPAFGPRGKPSASQDNHPTLAERA
jgi:hypothetical protein